MVTEAESVRLMRNMNWRVKNVQINKGWLFGDLRKKYEKAELKYKSRTTTKHKRIPRKQTVKH